jgi:hypothetical protein
MQSEDLLSLVAVGISLAGLTGMLLLESVQEPLASTIGKLANAAEGSKWVVRARIEQWKEFKEFNRLELNDGNTVSVVAPKKLGIDWNQFAIFELTVLVQHSPKQQITVLEAKRV